MLASGKRTSKFFKPWVSEEGGVKGANPGFEKLPRKERLSLAGGMR
jgi:hypothetical protein